MNQCPDCSRARRRGFGFLNGGREFVELSDGFVELQAIERFGNGRNYAVTPPIQRLVFAFGRTVCRCEPPDTLDEPGRAFDAAFGPFEIALGRAVGEHEPADRVRAVAGDYRLRIYRVALRLRHLFDAAECNRRAAFDVDPIVAGLLDLVGLSQLPSPAR